MASLIFLRNSPIAWQQTNALGIVALKASYSTEGQRPLKTTNLAALKRGTGGRSSFNGIVATVFGCGGFVGRYVCNKLGKIGTQLILPYRGEHSDVIRLKVAGDLGQVLFHFFHLNDEESIREAVKYSNVVINLIGREYKTKNFTLDDVHVKGAARIAKVCQEMKVERLIHLSALNASAQPKGHILRKGSEFLRTKFHGEEAVLREFPRATIIRPSDIYGSEDRFLRYYAHIWRRQFRYMPLWCKGEKTVKQPVYVGDIAQAILNCATDPDTAGKIYQAVGPKRYLLSDLVDWFHYLMRKDEKWWGYMRYDLRYDPTIMMKARITQMLPGTPIGGLHVDRLERECVTDFVEPSVPTLEDLDVCLTEMENQVPWELRPYRAALYYDAELGEFETPQPPTPLDYKKE